MANFQSDLCVTIFLAQQNKHHFWQLLAKVHRLCYRKLVLKKKSQKVVPLVSIV